MLNRKNGETGKADADRQKDIQIAEFNRDRDVKIAITSKDKEVSIAAADKDQAIGKAEAERDARIATSMANSLAVRGENEAKITIANSDAERREREAEALKLATAAEKYKRQKLWRNLMLQNRKQKLRVRKENVLHRMPILLYLLKLLNKSHYRSTGTGRKIRLQAKGKLMLFMQNGS